MFFEETEQKQASRSTKASDESRKLAKEIWAWGWTCCTERELLNAVTHSLQQYREFKRLVKLTETPFAAYLELHCVCLSPVDFVEMFFQKLWESEWPMMKMRQVRLDWRESDDFIRLGRAWSREYQGNQLAWTQLMKELENA